MRAYIYRPAKTAMQSGKKNTVKWKLEIEQTNSRYIECLMGWNGFKDTTQQIALYFPTMETAVKYAKNYYPEYEIILPHESKPKIRTYAENFTD